MYVNLRPVSTEIFEVLPWLIFIDTITGSIYFIQSSWAFIEKKFDCILGLSQLVLNSRAFVKKLRFKDLICIKADLPIPFNEIAVILFRKLFSKTKI